PSHVQLSATFQDVDQQIRIHQRVKLEELNDLIKHQLTSRHLDIDFEFAIFSRGLSTRVATEGFAFTQNTDEIYSVPLFIDENRSYNYELMLSFPKKQKIGRA